MPIVIGESLPSALEPCRPRIWTSFAESCATVLASASPDFPGLSLNCWTGDEPTGR
jgi:hypothetical protein